MGRLGSHFVRSTGFSRSSVIPPKGGTTNGFDRWVEFVRKRMVLRAIREFTRLRFGLVLTKVERQKFTAAFCLCFVLLLLFTGCENNGSQVNQITLWHQMTVGEREVLDQQIAKFEAANPGVSVKALYKETEELRSGFPVSYTHLTPADE